MNESITLTGRATEIFGKNPSKKDRITIVGEIITDPIKAKDGIERFVVNIESSMISKPNTIKENTQEKQEILDNIALLRKALETAKAQEKPKTHNNPPFEEPPDIQNDIPTEFTQEMIEAIQNDELENTEFNYTENMTKEEKTIDPWEEVPGSNMKGPDPYDPFS